MSYYGELVHTETDGPITFELYITQDDMDIRGNALASGDDAVDTQTEDDILDRLNNGDTWAWASVICRASAGEHEGLDHLGGCSYASTEDFVAPGGYWDDMKTEAKTQLLATLEDAGVKLKAIRKAKKGR